MTSSNAICRIGVFYDGSFFTYAQHYYYHERDLMHARVSMWLSPSTPFRSAWTAKSILPCS